MDSPEFRILHALLSQVEAQPAYQKAVAKGGAFYDLVIMMVYVKHEALGFFIWILILIYCIFVRTLNTWEEMMYFDRWILNSERRRKLAICMPEHHHMVNRYGFARKLGCDESAAIWTQDTFVRLLNKTKLFYAYGRSEEHILKYHRESLYIDHGEDDKVEQLGCESLAHRGSKTMRLLLSILRPWLAILLRARCYWSQSLPKKSATNTLIFPKFMVNITRNRWTFVCFCSVMLSAIWLKPIVLQCVFTSIWSIDYQFYDTP